MQKLLALLLLAFLPATAFTQVVGTITDTEGNTLPYVNIYIEGSFTGTTSNNEGNYELELKQKGEQTIVFQFLGFKTLKKTINITQFPFKMDVSLTEETTSLEEVVVNSDENPASRVIRKAIAHRKENQAKIKAYTADFYSRGLWKIKNAPEKILGAEIGDLGGGLDSTRSGIIYLSETVSEIKYKAPEHFHEKVTASKVSGNDNGFSLNSASDADFSFYDNTIAINAKLISPIADYAFSYYDYTLEGIFYDDLGNLINKIEVTPKRKKDRVFSGYIYIIENAWEIYGIDLKTTGNAIQVPPIEELVFKQNFTYSEKHQLWVKLSQKVDFSWKMFGISGNGRFTAAYSNYDFSPDFSENTFSNELMGFAEKANKKDSVFWQNVRPIPLTPEEEEDYVKKDSIQEIRNSKTYKDSVDRATNKFSITDPLFGYHYQNSTKNFDFDISAPITGIHYNTVQGWNADISINFTKQQEEYNKYWQIFSDMNYGFSDDRFRVHGGFLKKFNNTSKPILKLEGGIAAQSINDTDALPLIVNDVANILFERNYLKLYDRLFAEASYTQEIFNGFQLFATTSFEKRSPLINTTNHIIVENSNGGYTSNNPLAPENFGSIPFETHNIAKLNLTGKINFGQKYYNYPDGKFNVPNDDFPTLYFSYEKGFAATESAYNFDHLKIMLTQEVNLQNKGDLTYSLKGGKFFNSEDIALVDYEHFRGNQTRVKLSQTERQFNLLPYYSLSTNDEYAEGHLEHNFEGWVLGKIPFVNQLNFNLIIGAHSLLTSGNKPYSEFSAGIGNIGFGKYRFLRVDYVKPLYNGWQNGAFMFGLSIGL